MISNEMLLQICSGAVLILNPDRIVEQSQNTHVTCPQYVKPKPSPYEAHHITVSLSTL